MSAEQLPAGPAAAAVYARKLVACICYIAVSTILIRFNKYMMKKEHFPHALALSCIHMLVSSFLCTSLYLVCPALFPAMESTRGNRLSLMKWFLPIGVCFAIMLFGSNQAYLYCSVTFLQFMKEANVMIVFCFSCIVGLQACNRLRLIVIAWVIVGASIAVSGEIHFAWVGFVCQGVSQLAECTRMIMGEFVLSGRKLDPLTYTMFLSPVCLTVLVIANAVHWNPAIPAHLVKMWPLLLGNACVAFGLNVLVACVIKECSAVGFVLTGLAKDIVIVIFSAIAFGELVTHKQVAAFVVTLLGVGFWSYMKASPKSPLVRLFECMVLMPQEEPGEKTALLATAPEKKV